MDNWSPFMSVPSQVTLCQPALCFSLMTVDDFAAFVGSKHSITSPEDTSISAVVKVFNMVMTTYPEGKVELLKESNSSATMRWNRAYSSYFRNGPVLGVSIEELFPLHFECTHPVYYLSKG